MNQQLKWEIEAALKCPYQTTRLEILKAIGKQLKEDRE